MQWLYARGLWLPLMLVWVTSVAFADDPKAVVAPAPAPAAVVAAQPASPPATPAAPAPPATPPLTAAMAKKDHTTADHSKFEVLQKDFKSGPEVTEACLTCHTEAAKHVMKTKHWTWEYVDKSGKKLGKKNVINNFCTSAISNEKDCMACHAGYGWQDKHFDFKNEKNVDCLICHDSTMTYRKLPGDAGHPVYERKEFPKDSGKFVEAADLKMIAQLVAKPSRANCGSCHFYGAGGDGTKHGDLDSSLKKPGKYLDVHMDAGGLNFSCTTCHQTDEHKVSGSRYEMTAVMQDPAHLRGAKGDKDAASCQSCHGDKPHQQNPLLMGQLNSHTSKLACQTCHIPEYARGGVGTEKLWDWSTATKMGADGKPLATKDSAGRRAVDSKKGTFVWDSYLIPEYMWFNGEMNYLARGDKIDPSKTVNVNKPEGTAGAVDSRIWPFKVHQGKQAYDKEFSYLLNVHTAGEDDTALWHNFDWQKAITAGMTSAEMPYSGKYGFVSTEMSWPITHMVAPKGDALACAQCHQAESRLKGIGGVYMPGVDGNKYLDMFGWAAAILTLLGVIIHGALRTICVSRKKRGLVCQRW